LYNKIKVKIAIKVNIHHITIWHSCNEIATSPAVNKLIELIDGTQQLASCIVRVTFCYARRGCLQAIVVWLVTTILTALNWHMFLLVAGDLRRCIESCLMKYAMAFVMIRRASVSAIWQVQ